MIKAYSYLRVSGISQIDKDGPTRQREKIAEYAKRKGIEITQEFRDDGVSGTVDGFDRPGLQELTASMETSGVRIVLIERADRLARDLMVSEIILAHFRKLGASVIAVDADNDLTALDQDPTRILMRQILGAIAQWEKSVMVMKTRAARMRIRKEKGRCEGRKPYGTRPGEQQVLGEIAMKRGVGWTFHNIAESLNEQGIKPRHSGRWHSNTVRRILERV